MKSIKLKSFIFEETDKKTEEMDILEIFEDIVLKTENHGQSTQIIKSLTKRDENTYFFQVSVGEGRVGLEIIFDKQFLKSDEIIVEIIPLERDPEFEPDQEFIFFDNEEDLKAKVLKFVFSGFQKYVNNSRLQHEKHDYASDFQETYKQVFEKNGFKVIEGSELVGDQDFFVEATDDQGRYVSFLIEFDDKKISAVLMSEILDEELRSRNIYFLNHEYNLEKALNSVVSDLASWYDFYQLEF